MPLRAYAGGADTLQFASLRDGTLHLSALRLAHTGDRCRGHGCACIQPGFDRRPPGRTHLPAPPLSLHARRTHSSGPHRCRRAFPLVRWAARARHDATLLPLTRSAVANAPLSDGARRGGRLTHAWRSAGRRRAVVLCVVRLVNGRAWLRWCVARTHAAAQGRRWVQVARIQRLDPRRASPVWQSGCRCHPRRPKRNRRRMKRSDEASGEEMAADEGHTEEAQPQSWTRRVLLSRRTACPDDSSIPRGGGRRRAASPSSSSTCRKGSMPFRRRWRPRRRRRRRASISPEGVEWEQGNDDPRLMEAMLIAPVPPGGGWWRRHAAPQRRVHPVAHAPARACVRAG